MAWALLDSAPAGARAPRHRKTREETMRLSDPRFKYVPSTRTDVAATWRKFGFRPTTESERRARRLREPPVEGTVDIGCAFATSFRSAARPALKFVARD